MSSSYIEALIAQRLAVQKRIVEHIINYYKATGQGVSLSDIAEQMKMQRGTVRSTIARPIPSSLTTQMKNHNAPVDKLPGANAKPDWAKKRKHRMLVFLPMNYRELQCGTK